MIYTHNYISPLGAMLMAADDTGLTGLWFEGQKYFPEKSGNDCRECNPAVFAAAEKWLDIYFSGHDPGFTVPLHLTGTSFQNDVWNILLTIPYGTTVSYKDIAARLAAKRGIVRMSAQAVGGAVGRNPVSVIVPCHRVVGANGNLTGYAGGIDKKIMLLKYEGAFQKHFFIP